MQINVVSTFLHGETRYETEKVYDVSEGEALYFVNNGWATFVDANTSPTPLQDVVKDLEVHDGAVETKDVV